ncbi:2-methoxy-6-polyprenyl-1,4-benzoquinol methylase [subsurface metagenome]
MEITWVVLGAIFLSLGLPRIIDKRRRSPAQPFLGRLLDSGLRRWVQSPDKIIERSGIKRGMNILDLGCGSGTFTTLLARVVGALSKVYAVDIQPAMLKQLQRKLAKAENEDIRNVEIKQASAYELPFEDKVLDLVFMVAALQEIYDRDRALREVKRVLKPGGILAVTEFIPDTDYPRRSTTIKLCQQEGFVLDGSLGNFWNYTVRFKKPTSG